MSLMIFENLVFEGYFFFNTRYIKFQAFSIKTRQPLFMNPTLKNGVLKD